MERRACYILKECIIGFRSSFPLIQLLIICLLYCIVVVVDSLGLFLPWTFYELVCSTSTESYMFIELIHIDQSSEMNDIQEKLNLVMVEII